MDHKPGDVVRVVDQSVPRDTFLIDVLEGLRLPQKEIFSKYFYDRRGSELFDDITELEEYYPTRTEWGIMTTNIDEIVFEIGPEVMLVEYGSGSSAKTRILLDHLVDQIAYVPIDISKGHLIDTAEGIAAAYPSLRVLPVVADYTQDIELPRPSRPPRRVVGYFPGSTIGNFDRDAAHEFLGAIAREVGEGGGLLIGVDLKKDRAILENAYNDAKGVTAEFNLNLLHRINRELGADFDPHQFEHCAFWSKAEGRIEMHLRSRKAQTVHIGGVAIHFAEGETIHTENSHKFSVAEFGELAKPWFEQRNVWVDEGRLFSVQYLETSNTGEGRADAPATPAPE